MQLRVELNENSYPIIMEKGVLSHVHQYLNLNRKVLVIRDDGVNAAYAQKIIAQGEQMFEFVIEQGEQSKSLLTYKAICSYLLKLHFSRNDLIIALGGGVVGDLSGFVAATYMRGIQFVQIPTTSLAQIDSSIGGKVAIDFNGVKNILGCFYQPHAVFIDVSLLATLSKRHMANGLIEALKAGLIYDKALFSLFENERIEDHLEEIIERALLVKKNIVEQDEKEANIRKILNFGHTVGHAIESYYQLGEYLHGECVANGMLYFIKDLELKMRLTKIYDKLGIPYPLKIDIERVFAFLKNDKKADQDVVHVIIVEEMGKAVVEAYSYDEIYDVLKGEVV